jgi:hypothetical protein
MVTVVTKLFTIGQKRPKGVACYACYGYLLNRLVDFHEILYGGDAIQGDLDAIIFNPVPSTNLK